MTKNLYIISGCNGAGKTTASFTIQQGIEIKEKVLKGLEISSKKLLAEKRAKGQKLVVLRDNKIVTITP